MSYQARVSIGIANIQSIFLQISPGFKINIEVYFAKNMCDYNYN